MGILGKLKYGKWWTENIDPSIRSWLNRRAAAWVDPKEEAKKFPQRNLTDASGKWYPNKLDISDKKVVDFLSNFIDLMEGRWFQPEYVEEFIGIVYDIIAAKRGARSYPKCCVRELLGLSLPEELHSYQLESRGYRCYSGHKCELNHPPQEPKKPKSATSVPTFGRINRRKT